MHGKKTRCDPAIHIITNESPTAACAFSTYVCISVLYELKTNSLLVPGRSYPFQFGVDPVDLSFVDEEEVLAVLEDDPGDGHQLPRPHVQVSQRHSKLK